MNKLFALIGFTGICVLAAVFFIGEWVGAFFLCLGSVGVIFSIIMLVLKKEKNGMMKLLIICVSTILFIGYGQFYSFFVSQPFSNNEIENQTLNFTATLQDEPYFSNGYIYYQLQAKSVDEQSESFNFLFRSDEKLEAEAFDEISSSAYFVYADSTYYRAKNISYLAYADIYNFAYDVKKAEGRPPYYYTIALRNALSQAIGETMRPEYAGFCRALILGEGHELSPEVKNNFKTTGLMHIIVVSGQHLSILTLCLSKLFAKFGKRSHILTIVLCGIIFLYMGITAFSPSIVRSGIVMIILLLGRLFYKQISQINSLGIAAMLILLFNPNSAGDIGMLLSFAATAGLVQWSDKIGKWLRKKLNLYTLTEKIKSESIKSATNKAIRGFIGIISATIAATIGTAPIIILAFGTFSPISLMANLFIAPVAGVAIILGMLTGLTCFTWIISLISGMFAFFTSLIFRYMFTVVEYMSKIPYGFLNIDNDYMLICLALIFVIIAMLSVLKQWQKQFKTAVLVCVIIILGGGVSSWLLNFGEVDAVIMQSENGNTVILQTENRAAIINLSSDSHAASNVVNYFANSGKSIDFLLISSEKNRNYNELLLGESVGMILISNKQSNNLTLLDITKNSGETKKFSNEHSVNLWNNAELLIFETEGKTAILVATANSKLLIIPTEMDFDNLPEKFLAADKVIYSDMAGEKKSAAQKIRI